MKRATTHIWFVDVDEMVECELLNDEMVDVLFWKTVVHIHELLTLLSLHEIDEKQ